MTNSKQSLSVEEHRHLSQFAEQTLADREQGKGRAMIALGILRARDELTALRSRSSLEDNSNG